MPKHGKTEFSPGEMADSVGAHTYGADLLLVRRWDSPTNPHIPVTIGRYCSIADKVEIFTNGNHHAERVTTYPFAERGWLPLSPANASAYGKGPIVIGNDVWLGSASKIMSGIGIGDGAIVAAGSVVSRNVGPYEVVGGNPARLLRKRFPEETIQRLLRVAWWNWPDEQVREAIPLLTKDDNCLEFLQKYD